MKFQTNCCLCLFQFFGTIVCSVPDEFRDYCEEESFVAECSEGTAILIDGALYGRMRPGRCITNEDTGCKADVQSHLDRWCSGRRHCTVAVTSLIRSASGICSRDRRGYLEASYTCVPVVRGHAGGCDSSTSEPTEITSASGYISSYVTAETGCGSLDSPWRIRAASRGQRINFTLLDFSAASAVGGRSATVAPPTSGQNNNKNDVCTVYAIIKEAPVGQTTTVCGGRTRQEVVFVSSEHSIDVRLIGKRRSDDNDPKFMLHYRVIGCADPVLPPGTALNRDEGRAVVSCLLTPRRQWQLRCNGSEWNPDPVNALFRDDFLCDNEDGKLSVSGERESEVPIHFQGLSIVIVAVVAAMVGLTILLAGIGYLRRKRRLRKFSDGHCRLGTKGRTPGDGEWLGATVHEPSKQCGASDTMYLGSQSYITSRWPPPPPTGQGVGAASAAAVALSPPRCVRSPDPEYGTAAAGAAAAAGVGCHAVLRFSEHLYESPNFERRDVPTTTQTLGSSLTRHVDAGRRDDACALQQHGRRSTTDAVFAAK